MLPGRRHGGDQRKSNARLSLYVIGIASGGSIPSIIGWDSNSTEPPTTRINPSIVPGMCGRRRVRRPS